MMKQNYAVQDREDRIESADGHGGLPSGSPRRRALLWIGVALVILVAMAVMRRGGKPTSGPAAPRSAVPVSGPPPAVLVTVARPSQAPVQEAIEITGTIRARQQVTL